MTLDLLPPEFRWRIVGSGGLRYPPFVCSESEAVVRFAPKSRAHLTLGLRLQYQTPTGWDTFDVFGPPLPAGSVEALGLENPECESCGELRPATRAVE